MQARCPHCTSVFTTDRTGVQFCPSCGRQINVPAPPGAPPPSPPPPPPATPAAAVPGAPGGGSQGQVLPPPAGGPVGPGAPPPGGTLPPGGPGGPARVPGPTPWERRKELGFWRGWGQTLKQSMFSPEEFWSSVRPDGPIGDPILFAWLTLAITSAITAYPNHAISTWLTRLMVSAGQFPPELRRLMEGERSPAFFWGWLVGYVLLMPAFAIIAGGIVHVLLLLTGGAKGGFSATMRAVCYAAGPLLFSLIPLVGGIVGSVYSAVLFFWGLVRLHRSDWWRPVLSFVLLLAFCCCCSFGLGIVVGIAQGVHP